MSDVPEPPPTEVYETGSNPWAFIAGGLFVLLLLVVLWYFFLGPARSPALAPTVVPAPRGSPGGVTVWFDVV